MTGGFLSGFPNLESLVWSPELSFWRCMNSVELSIKTMGERAFSRIFEKRLREGLPPLGEHLLSALGRSNLDVSH